MFPRVHPAPPLGYNGSMEKNPYRAPESPDEEVPPKLRSILSRIDRFYGFGFDVLDKRFFFTPAARAFAESDLARLPIA